MSNIITAGVPTDYETATSHTITVRETLVGALNNPRDTVLTIIVVDVAEVVPPTFVATYHYLGF